MKALIFDLRLNSLYSIRVPFTWQSALTYPILPPSAVIGMVANALQRYKNDKHPLEYLDYLENQIVWAGSRLQGPCVIKSYVTSAITKWEYNLGGKFTNALGRQFAYTRNLQAVLIFQQSIPDKLCDSIMATPLTAGDSESSISLENAPYIKEVEEIKIECEKTEITLFPIPFNTKILEGGGRVYLMHKRCLKKGKEFPLFSYICPMREDNGSLNPSPIKVLLKSGDTILKIEGLEGGIIIASGYKD